MAATRETPQQTSHCPSTMVHMNLQPAATAQGESKQPRRLPSAEWERGALRVGSSSPFPRPEKQLHPSTKWKIYPASPPCSHACRGDSIRHRHRLASESMRKGKALTGCTSSLVHIGGQGCVAGAAKRPLEHKRRSHVSALAWRRPRQRLSKPPRERTWSFYNRRLTASRLAL